MAVNETFRKKRLYQKRLAFMGRLYTGKVQDSPSGSAAAWSIAVEVIYFLCTLSGWLSVRFLDHSPLDALVGAVAVTGWTETACLVAVLASHLVWFVLSALILIISPVIGLIISLPAVFLAAGFMGTVVCDDLPFVLFPVLAFSVPVMITILMTRGKTPAAALPVLISFSIMIFVHVTAEPLSQAPRSVFASVMVSFILLFAAITWVIIIVACRQEISRVIEQASAMRRGLIPIVFAYNLAFAYFILLLLECVIRRRSSS